MIGHGDWHPENLCWQGPQLITVHDWDSVICQPEPAIAGLAAATFLGIDSPGPLASVEDSAAFLDAYQHARGRRWTSADYAAEELLERVGLANRARFLPTALSGGQRQRVAVARALVADPLVVLADEPTGNLDSASTRDVLQLFDQLHRAGQTLVIVTHDVQVAATADRMISMSDGAFIKQTMPRDGIGGHVGALAGMEG